MIRFCMPLCLVGLITIPALAAGDASSAKPELLVEVRVAASCSGPASLKVTLTNRTNATVTVREAALPWNMSQMLETEAVRMAGEKVVRLPAAYPAATWFDVVTIAPGKSISGELDLRDIHPTLEDARSSGPVLVFFRLKNSPRPDPVAYFVRPGTVVVPERRFFGSGCAKVVHPFGGS